MFLKLAAGWIYVVSQCTLLARVARWVSSAVRVAVCPVTRQVPAVTRLSPAACGDWSPDPQQRPRSGHASVFQKERSSGVPSVHISPRASYHPQVPYNA